MSSAAELLLPVRSHLVQADQIGHDTVTTYYTRYRRQACAGRKCRIHRIDQANACRDLFPSVHILDRLFPCKSHRRSVYYREKPLKKSVRKYDESALLRRRGSRRQVVGSRTHTRLLPSSLFPDEVLDL